MAGLLSGFLGGVGKGLSESAKMLYDQQREDKQYERQVQRDDAMAVRQDVRDEVQAQRQDVRDERNHQQTLALRREDLKIKLEETRAVIDINRQYDATDLAAAQEAIAAAGGNFTKALSMAKTTRGAELIAKYQQLDLDRRKTESGIETDRAQRASAGTTASLNNLRIQEARGDMGEKDVERKLKTELRAAIAKGDTASADRLRSQLNAGATANGDYSVVYEADETGEKKPVGLLNQKSGTVSPYRVNNGGNMTPYQEYQQAFQAAAGDKAKQAAITDRARKLGVVK